MDDQAHQLRRLVQACRHASQSSTGPPLFLVAAPNATTRAIHFAGKLHELCAKRGIKTSLDDSLGRECAQVDWRLASIVGPYQSNDLKYWQQASICLLVSDHDDASVVDSYKLLKQVAQDTPLPTLHLFVWSESDTEKADLAAKRLKATCGEFLPATISETTVFASLEDLFLEHSDTLIERLAAVAPLSPTTTNIPIASDTTL